jgi:hypothetical protein
VITDPPILEGDLPEFFMDSSLRKVYNGKSSVNECWLYQKEQMR